MKKMILVGVAGSVVMASVLALNPLHYFATKAAIHAASNNQQQPTTFNSSPNQMARTVGNGGKALNCSNHFPLGMPVVAHSEHDKVERRSFYLCRDAYAVQFDPAFKTAIWSAENLTADRMAGAKEPRANDFQPDPEVPYAAQAALNDYKSSHFDRGHMSPAADMKIYNMVLRPEQLHDANTKAMSQSFYLTNMVPQVGPNQNRGIWADLEGQVRNWASEKGQLLVATGPIYDAGFQFMGHSRVAVPTRLYKVIINTKTYEAIAFIIPNRQIVTRKTHSLDEGNPEFPQTTPAQAINCQPKVCTVANFAVPVAQVEKVTGLRFFSNLSASDHDKVVNVMNPNAWNMH
jgi:endonuclease G